MMRAAPPWAILAVIALYCRMALSQPSLDFARKAALKLVPARAETELAALVRTDRGPIPFVAVSYPVDKPVNRYLPVDKDYVLKLFVFLSTTPSLIRRHPFLKPSDIVWEDTGCSALKRFPLRKGKGLPLVLGQHCWYEGEFFYRYAVFDENCLTQPIVGTATWNYSAYPDAPHQAFVLDPDPLLPYNHPTRRGDGETIVDGIEGHRVKGKGQDVFEVRDFRTLWRSGKLVSEYGSWILQR